MENSQDGAQSVRSKVEHTAVHTAKEVATKELAAAAGELYLFANLLNLTRGAAGIAAEQYLPTSQTSSVLFDTAVAIRDAVQPQTNHLVFRSAKLSALNALAGNLGQLADSLQQRTHAHREQLQSLQSLVSSGWHLMSESSANAAAVAHADLAAAAFKQLPANATGQSVHLVALPSAAEATPSRRMVPRVPHVLCLPPAWGTLSSRDYLSAAKQGRLLKPKMTAPLLLDTGSSSYRLALPASHSDLRMRVHVCAHGFLTRLPQQSTASVVVDVTKLAPIFTAATVPSSLHNMCTRVCRSVVLDLLWDCLTQDGLSLSKTLHDPMSGNRVSIRTEQQVQAVGKKRQRSDSSAGCQASLLRLSVTSTSLCAEIQVSSGTAPEDASEDASRRYTVIISVGHEQEARTGKDEATGNAAAQCAALLASFAYPATVDGRVPIMEALLGDATSANTGGHSGQGQGKRDNMLEKVLEVLVATA